MKENLLISKCFLGVNCKYNGGNNLIDKLTEIREKYNLIEACPEEEGGLSTPRNPSELNIDGRIYMNDGTDVTDEYNIGADIALKRALKNNCKIALLKEKSPSCGVHSRYNGEFNGTVIEGMGNTTKLLKEHGIKVYSELDLDKLL